MQKKSGSNHAANGGQNNSNSGSGGGKRNNHRRNRKRKRGGSQHEGDNNQHARSSGPQGGQPRRDHQQPRNRKPQQNNEQSSANKAANAAYGRYIENHIPKRYGIVMYETFAQARADLESIREKAKECDQLNIVIKAEGDMTDPELSVYGMVFAGAAWHLIHTRRLEEGWYNEPR